MLTGLLSRRRLFGRSALAGGAALAMARGAASAPASVQPAGFRLFDAADMNFEASFALGEAAYGAGEAGEILATVNAINAAGASYQAFYDGFVAVAQTVGKIAADALAAGHRASARSAYLRSAQYYDQALFVVLGTSTPHAEESVYQRMQQQWNAATQLWRCRDRAWLECADLRGAGPGLDAVRAQDPVPAGLGEGDNPDH